MQKNQQGNPQCNRMRLFTKLLHAIFAVKDYTLMPTCILEVEVGASHRDTPKRSCLKRKELIELR